MPSQLFPELNASKLTCYSGALLLWKSIILVPDLIMLSAVSGIGKQQMLLNSCGIATIKMMMSCWDCLGIKPHRETAVISSPTLVV